MRKIVLLTMLSVMLSMSCIVPDDPTSSFNFLLFDWNDVQLGAKLNVEAIKSENTVLFNYSRLKMKARDSNLMASYLDFNDTLLNRNTLYHHSDTNRGLTWDIESFGIGNAKKTVEDDILPFKKEVIMSEGYSFYQNDITKTVIEVKHYKINLSKEYNYYLFVGDNDGTGSVTLVGYKTYENGIEISSEGDFTYSSDTNPNF